MGLSNYLPSSRLSQAGVCTSSTRPASPYDGQVIYETDTDRTLVWNGSAWVFLSTGTSNNLGLELVSTCTVTSVGGTSATSSNGVITFGSANTSVTVSNAFSSTYDNYKIIISNATSSGTSDLSFQLSGITSSSYQIAGFYMTPGTATLNGYSPAVTTFWLLGPIGSSGFSHEFDVMSPNLARQKQMIALHGIHATGYYTFSGYCTSTSQATGFVLTTNGGMNLTSGTLRVYGYRNS